MFGKFFHLMVDATLVAMVLSGVRRTTGIVPSVHRVPNKDIRNILRAYLETGEWVRPPLHLLRYAYTLWKVPLPCSRCADWFRCLTSPLSFWGGRDTSSGRSHRLRRRHRSGGSNCLFLNPCLTSEASDHYPFGQHEPEPPFSEARHERVVSPDSSTLRMGLGGRLCGLQNLEGLQIPHQVPGHLLPSCTQLVHYSIRPLSSQASRALRAGHHRRPPRAAWQ